MGKQAARQTEVALTSEPSTAEQQAIAEAEMRVEARSPRLRVSLRQSKTGAVDALGAPHSDQHGWLMRLQNVFGTRGTAFAVSQLNRLMIACKDQHGTIDGSMLDGMLAMIEGAKPKNEVQAALAVQMAVTHAASLTILQRALRSDQIPQFECSSTAATKLLRTFTMQAELLAKLQRGGEQVVKVVHVHPGAQAVVGTVIASASKSLPGGGGIDENGNQPHAKARLSANASATLLEMRSEDPSCSPVPVACGGR